MTKSTTQMTWPSARHLSSAWRADCKHTGWLQCREASLNWLALGVLLAAWNSSDSDAAQDPRRPAALRGYSTVSVRAVSMRAEQRHIAPTL